MQQTTLQTPQHNPSLPVNSLESTAACYPSIWQSWVIIAIVILLTIVCIPTLQLGQLIGAEGAMMTYYLLTYGLSFFVVHSIRKRKLGASHFNFRIESWRLLLPLSIGSLALLFGVAAPLSALIPMPEAMKGSMQSAVGATGILTFIYFVLAAPILEELTFRGMMLDGLLRKYQPTKAIVVSAFFFGLVHLNPWQFVTGFILGCYLGWVYLRTASVSACIVIHMSANLSGYALRLYLRFAESSVQNDQTVAPSDPSSQIVTILVLVIVFAASVYWLQRETANEASGTHQIPAA